MSNLAAVAFHIIIGAAAYLLAIPEKKENGFLEKLCEAFVYFFSFLIGWPVILSLFNKFDQEGLWLGGILFFLLALAIKVKRINKTDSTIGKSEIKVVTIGCILTGIVIYRSFGIIDITHDAMVYIMPRIHLFIQEKSFLHDTFTNIYNIWFNQMNFEILSAIWNIISGEVFLAKTPNQLWFFFSFPISYLLLRKLDLKENYALAGTFILGTLPVFFLVSHTIKNDFALYVGAITICYYFLSYVEAPKIKTFFLLCLATAITIGIKTTILPFVAAITVYLLISSWKEIKKSKSSYFICFLAIILIGGHRYIANFFHYQNPFIRSVGEEIVFSPSSLTNALSFQLNNILNADFVFLPTVTTLNEVLGASGGYSLFFLLPFFFLGLSTVGQIPKIRIFLLCAMIFHTLTIVLTRPWFNWSTRYLPLFFFLIVWLALIGLEKINRSSKTVGKMLFVIIFIFGYQVFHSISFDDSFWLKNSFHYQGVTSAYDSLDAHQKIEAKEPIMFVAHPDTPIFMYIKKDNPIYFCNAKTVTELKSCSEQHLKQKIKYFVVTNLYMDLVQELKNNPEFKALRIRDNINDQNHSNLFLKTTDV